MNSSLCLVVSVNDSFYFDFFSRDYCFESQKCYHIDFTMNILYYSLLQYRTFGVERNAMIWYIGINYAFNSKESYHNLNAIILVSKFVNIF